ncbi:MAG: sigma-70 family RNA polymerase sigma factor [Chitinophagaceae bacterium]|nr:sigma-70 family RNA polymerase sigma factor [Chitinophagaceae bacterium]
MDSYKTYTDEQLVQLLKQSDEAAYTELYHRYWKKMFYKAGQKLNNLPVAEEIIQDIFLDIWNRRASIELSANFSHYLASALKYKVINQQAKEYRELQYQRAHTLSPGQFDNSTTDYLEARELQKRIAELVAKLPEKCRLVYQFKQQGLTQQQISREMNISENTVETHIGRALKNLRTNLRSFFWSWFF